MSCKYLMQYVFSLFLNILVRPVIRFGFRVFNWRADKLKPLPPCKSELLMLSAHKMTEKIRNKEITSTELVKAYIMRIQEIQPLVNCVVKSCFEDALQEAANVDKILAQDTLLAKYSVKNAPLLGVPFSCKESFWVKGMPNSTGIVARKDFRAPEDAVIVKYMREAGAILLCVTNTSEGCMWLESSNYLNGTTRNPYNLSRIVGGSSGGEGCIVSSCGSAIGIGSDIGGSIRMPAFFNGVYGHKPTSNFINNAVQHPPTIGLQSDMLVSGPICRYASDLRLMFKIFSGQRYQEVAKNFESKLDFKSLKYFYIDDLQDSLYISKLSDDSRGAMQKAVSFLEKSLGVEVKKLSLSKLKQSFLMWNSMINVDEKTPFTEIIADFQGDTNVVLELFKSFLFLQNKHTLPALALSIVEKIPIPNKKINVEKSYELKKELKAILGDDGVLLFPSFPIVAPYHHQSLFTNTFDFLYYGIINSVGLPSTQIPLGLNSQGLPTGVQIVANHNMDHLTIGMAEYFETNLGGWVAPF